jgi:uncharacterized protein (TIGR02145 family)
MKSVFLIFAIAIGLVACGGNNSDTSSSSASENTIGEQVWMTKNLNVDKFRNGDPIPHAKTEEEWLNAYRNEEPAWCYYENDSINGEKYGKLYNMFAVMDRRGLAPEGWRIPSDADWTLLTDYLEGDLIAGGKMKSTGTQFWKSPNTGASNESGFSGLPGGFRYNNGIFGKIGLNAYWWSTYMSKEDSRELVLNYHSGDVERESFNEGQGLSVRCIRK